MKSYEIQSILMNTYPLQEVHVSGNDSYFQIIAVGEIFNGISSVQQQKIIYAPLMKYIKNNCIHALSIKAYTPKEWKKKNTFNDL